MRGGRPSLLAAGAALVLAVLALALVLVPVGPSSVRRSRAPRSRLGLHGGNAASADAASPTRGLIDSNASKAGQSLESAAPPPSCGKYAPPRNIIANSAAPAGGSLVILSAEHPGHAAAIAVASPPVAVKIVSNILSTSPRTPDINAPPGGPCNAFMLGHHSIHSSCVYRPKPPAGSPAIQEYHSVVVCWNHRVHWHSGAHPRVPCAVPRQTKAAAIWSLVFERRTAYD